MIPLLPPSLLRAALMVAPVVGSFPASAQTDPWVGDWYVHLFGVEVDGYAFDLSEEVIVDTATVTLLASGADNNTYQITPGGNPEVVEVVGDEFLLLAEFDGPGEGDPEANDPDDWYHQSLRIFPIGNDLALLLLSEAEYDDIFQGPQGQQIFRDMEFAASTLGIIGRVPVRFQDNPSWGGTYEMSSYSFDARVGFVGPYSSPEPLTVTFTSLGASQYEVTLDDAGRIETRIATDEGGLLRLRYSNRGGPAPQEVWWLFATLLDGTVVFATSEAAYRSQPQFNFGVEDYAHRAGFGERIEATDFGLLDPIEQEALPWRLSWLGWFTEFTSYPGWIFHGIHGWIWVEGSSGLIFVWYPELGYLATNPGIFPYYWQYDEQRWLYSYIDGAASSKPRWFLDLTAYNADPNPAKTQTEHAFSLPAVLP